MNNNINNILSNQNIIDNKLTETFDIFNNIIKTKNNDITFLKNNTIHYNLELISEQINNIKLKEIYIKKKIEKVTQNIDTYVKNKNKINKKETLSNILNTFDELINQ